MHGKMISVLIHLYYPESLKTILPQIGAELLKKAKLYINLVSNVPFDESLLEQYSDATILRTPNVGKDIGGKLALIDSLLFQGDDSEYWVFLHDKNSPHTPTGQYWRESLFSIATNQNLNKILDILKSPAVNVVTNKNFINNEWNAAKRKFETINNEIIFELLEKYKITPSSYQFAAGTMFWAKSAPLRDFFSKNAPLSIRATLEKGNVLDHHFGTNAHSWERLLSWISLGNTTAIAGIE